jgi:hypothetical protein
MYLRPFESDAGVSVATVVGERLLQQLASSVSDLGQLVVVGKPGEAEAITGLVTINLNPASWQAEIADLIRRSRLVVIRGALTYYVARELEFVGESLSLTRVVFWFPDANEVEYMEFSRTISTYLRCATPPTAEGRVHFAYVDSGGTIRDRSIQEAISHTGNGGIGASSATRVF